MNCTGTKRKRKNQEQKDNTLEIEGKHDKLNMMTILRQFRDSVPLDLRSNEDGSVSVANYIGTIFVDEKKNKKLIYKVQTLVGAGHVKTKDFDPVKYSNNLSETLLAAELYRKQQSDIFKGTTWCATSYRQQGRDIPETVKQFIVWFFGGDGCLKGHNLPQINFTQSCNQKVPEIF